MKTRIKELREAKGLSQSEFAQKAGVARTIINQLESGNREIIKSDTMLKISKALDAPIEDIFLF